MSDTSSALADWAQLYYHGLGPNPPTASTVGDSTLAAAAATACSSPSIEGRVGKSARRRSRASRRAPVTLLNTDTTNFRAMVQQFTGISSGSYSSSSLSNGPVINFGLGYGEQFNQGGGMGIPVDHLQQHQYHRQSYQPQQQQQHHHHHQQHQYHYDESMFAAAAAAGGGEGGNHNTTSSSSNNNHHHHHHHNNNSNVFVHGFGNSSTNLEMSDGLILDGVSSRMMPKMPSTNNRVDGYFT